MNSEPGMLDLYCGAGGAAKGYADAGFTVVGVDIHPQPRYPYRFIQFDALSYLEIVMAQAENGFHPWAAIHASPPCQRYSRMSNARPGLAAKYPALIGPTRSRLEKIGLPYVIENVVGAPLIDPITLCGWTFGYETYRHRQFESNINLLEPVHRKHETPAARAGHWEPGKFVSVSGNYAPIALSRKVMDIDWMTRPELAEAIPPYFTRYIGTQLLDYLSMRGAA